MAVSYVWPISLPQNVRKEWSGSFGVPVLRTPMDAGVPKLRRRGLRTGQMSVSFEMTTAQLTTLKTFVEDTIKGVARFGFPDPRTGAQLEVQILPTDNGRLWDESYLSPGRWVVNMALVVMP